MSRVDPTPPQRRRLLETNARRCCVCKREGLGLNLHHIDGNSSRTSDENLAVLCVEDHDRHHRPHGYGSQARHLDLSVSKIRAYKHPWEAFVSEARKVSPQVVAVLSVYGTLKLIHSAQLVMQWPDGRIEYQR